MTPHPSPPRIPYRPPPTRAKPSTPIPSHPIPPHRSGSPPGESAVAIPHTLACTPPSLSIASGSAPTSKASPLCRHGRFLCRPFLHRIPHSSRSHPLHARPPACRPPHHLLRCARSPRHPQPARPRAAHHRLSRALHRSRPLHLIRPLHLVRPLHLSRPRNPTPSCS